jgi:hypothetical protein
LPTDSASRDQRFIEMQRGQSRLKALKTHSIQTTVS